MNNFVKAQLERKARNIIEIACEKISDTGAFDFTLVEVANEVDGEVGPDDSIILDGITIEMDGSQMADESHAGTTKRNWWPK